MGGTVGIVPNPVSGKDIRRLVANAASSTLAEKYTIVRRAVLGAVEAGADRFLFLREPHGLCAKAVETLTLDGVTFEHVDVEIRNDETDTTRTVAAMRNTGVGAVIVLGGDGTSRAATLGWRDVPLIAMSTGTNNVFPRFVEATVAGEAAGLVAAGRVRLDEVATVAKVVEVAVEGDDRVDLALIDAVVLDEQLVGDRSLFDPARMQLAVLSRAEPASVGISSIGGLVHPCGAADPGGVVVRFAPPATAARHLRAPLAPGWYATVGLDEVAALAEDEPVEVVGPAVLAFDGERQRFLEPGRRAVLRVRRNGPRVIDTARALTFAAERGVFVHAAGSVTLRPDGPRHLPGTCC